MPLHIASLALLALTIQLVLATREGFDLLDDGLQVASAGILLVLVVHLTKARTRRQRELILRILDELGQPLTVLRGYLSMFADGTLRSLDGKLDVLVAQCDNMHQIRGKLVEAIRRD